METASRKHPHLKRYKTRGIWFWKVTFQLLGHQVRKQGFISYQAAEQYYHSVRALIRSGEFGSVSANEMRGWSMQEMWELFFRTTGSSRAPATKRNAGNFWRNHGEELIGSYKVVDVSRKVLTAFVGKLRDRGLTDNSIGTLRAEVMNVLRFALDYEVIDYLPMFPRLKKTPQMKEIASPEEVFDIASQAPSRQWRDMILTQYTLALRVGELLGLSPGKFNLDEGWVMIDCQRLRSRENPGRFIVGPTKTRLSRKLPLSPTFIEMIRPYVEDRPSDVPLWISDHLTPASRRGYSEMLHKSVERSDVEKNISTHCLRASMLDYLVNKTNLGVQAVAYYARHSVKILVSRYSQADVEGLFAFFQRSEPVRLTQSCDLLATINLETL